MCMKAERFGQNGPSRRQVIVGGSAVLGTASLSGCSAILDWVEDFVLSDVHIFNQTDDQRSGEIMIEDSDGEAVIDDPLTFDLKEEDDDSDDENGEAFGEVYDDIWEEDGEYTVTVTLDEESAINDTDEVETEIELSDIEEEHLMIYLFNQETVDEEDQIDSVVEMIVVEGFADVDDKLGDVAWSEEDE